MSVWRTYPTLHCVTAVQGMLVHVLATSHSTLPFGV